MNNIASYQEGYTDGYADGLINEFKYIKRELTNFYNDNYENDATAEFCKGYNLALNHLMEVLKDIETEEET